MTTLTCFSTRMYYLNNICCICFIDKTDLKQLSELNSEPISYYDKLISSIPEMHFKEMNNQRLICKKCCISLEDTYEFRKKCLKSKKVFIDYLSQLNSVSNVIGEVKVRITDIGSELNNYVKIEEDEPKTDHFESTIKNEETTNNNTDENQGFHFLNVHEIKTEITEPEEYIREESSQDGYVEEQYSQEEYPSELVGASTSQEYLVEELTPWESYNPREGYNPARPDLDQSDQFQDPKGHYICDICGKDFPHWSYLRYHRSLHNGQRPYHCTVCNKTFKDKGNLNSHLRNHEDKPFTCHICNKDFEDMETLLRHGLVHNGHRLYQCHMCDRGFTSKQGLEKHIRIHTGYRPYVCNVCSKKFNSTSHLTVHMRVHTGEKPYSCCFCDKKFTDKSNLNRHIIRHNQNRT